MRLKPAGLGPFHVLADLPDLGHVHRIVRERPAFDQFAQVLAVEGLVDDLEQPGLDFGLVAVADGVQQQFAKRPVLEGQWPSTSNTWPPRAFAFLVELFEQPVIDLAFARVLGDEVPQVADFGLADAVDAAEALFQAVRVPGQVVVDHQVGALQVDAFAGGVGGDEDFDFLVVLEGFLGLAPFFAADAAVNDDDGLRPAEQCPNLLGEIVQRVAVLGEDDEFPAMPVGVEHFGVVLQQLGKLVPFAVGAGLPDAKRGSLQVLQLVDFGPQFGDGAGGGCLIDDLLLGVFDFGVGCVVEVFEVVEREVPASPAFKSRPTSLAAFEKLLLAKPLFQAFAAAAQGLVNGFGREARRRCRMVRAKPTVPLRPSFSRASARLNSSRT